MSPPRDPMFKPGARLDGPWTPLDSVQSLNDSEPLDDNTRIHPSDAAARNLAGDQIKRIMLEEMCDFHRAMQLLELRTPGVLERAKQSYANPRRITVSEARRLGRRS